MWSVTPQLGGGGKRFMWSVSDDGGQTWLAPRPHPDLVYLRAVCCAHCMMC